MENNSSIFILKNIEDWYPLGSRNDSEARKIKTNPGLKFLENICLNKGFCSYFRIPSMSLGMGFSAV